MAHADVISQRAVAIANSTDFVFDGRVIVSVGRIPLSGPVYVRVGSVGYSNKSGTLETGEFIRFERGDDEVYEVRLIEISDNRALFNVSMFHPSRIVGEISRLNERIIWTTTTSTQDQFSEQEMALLKAKLLLFEERLQVDFVETSEQARFIRDKIDYLIQSLTIQTKMNWLYMAVGVLTSISMTLGVSAANDDKFWKIIKTLLDIPTQFLLSN